MLERNHEIKNLRQDLHSQFPRESFWDLVTGIKDRNWNAVIQDLYKIQDAYTPEAIESGILDRSLHFQKFQLSITGNILHLMLLYQAPEEVYDAFLPMLGNRKTTFLNTAALDTKNTAQYLPVEIAVQSKNQTALTFLLSNGADANPSTSTSLLSKACLRNQFPDDKLDSISQLIQKFGGSLRQTDFQDSLGIDKYISLRQLRVECSIAGWNLVGADLCGTDLSTAQGIEYSELSGAVYSPTTKLPDELHPVSLQMSRAIFDRMSGDFVHPSQFDLYIARNHNLTKTSYKKFHKTYGDGVRSTGFSGYQRRRLITESYREPKYIDPEPLINLLPGIQNRRDALDFVKVLMRMEKGLDDVYYYSRRNQTAGVHPMEPEWMAMLSMLDTKDPVIINALTRCLTGQTQWISLGSIPRHAIRIPTVKTWGQGGRRSLSFKTRKYLARSLRDPDFGLKLPSVLEEFGYNIILRDSDKDHTNKAGKRRKGLGIGSVLSPERIATLAATPTDVAHTGIKEFHPYTYIESRHGYDMVSVPELGTLIIRNSSRDFGRDRLKYTVAYSDRSIASPGFKNEIKYFNRDTYGRFFVSIFNKGLARKTNPAPERITQLLGHLLHEETCFNKWLFDTDPDTAFEKSPFDNTQVVIGGYRAEGFKKYLEMAESLFRTYPEGDTALAFTFLPKGQIPYTGNTFPTNVETFISDPDYYGGEPRGAIAELDYLPITPKRLELLKKLSESDILSGAFVDELDQEGILYFIQVAGFEQHGIPSLTEIWKNEMW